MKKPLNTTEAAAFLGVAVETLVALRAKRSGPPFLTLVSGVMYKEEDLIAYAEENPIVDPSTYVKKV
jgi:hypothetical protein